MNFKRILFLLSVLFQFSVDAQIVAFPGAEGFGKFTTGGRGGETILVTNLNDSGPGSFREAAVKKTKRIILFRVAGTIHLQTKLNIFGDVTIAGQTAPGDGICIADQSVVLGGNNIIIRYLRFRLGDKFQRGEMINGNGGDDAFGGSKRKNIIIDHCSMSWSNDEVFSIYAGDSTTLQWNLIAEPLNYSYHFETGDKNFENHGYGGIWGGKHLSAHHNLFAHCVSRNPRFNGARLGADEELVDFTNNVIYNWQQNSVYGGEGGSYNVTNNYYRPGPSTNTKVKERIVNPTKNDVKNFGQFYVNGNIVDGAIQVTQNNLLGVYMEGTNQDKLNTIVGEPFQVIAIPKENAAEAYLKVIGKVGASLKRDTLDQRIIQDVEQRRGRIIDVQGGYVHGTPFEQTISAWPTLQTAPIELDSDNDGIPNTWEIVHGLDPENANDAQKFTIMLGYSNIEVYFNSIVKDK
jgi:pectate lyase